MGSIVDENGTDISFEYGSLIATRLLLGIQLH
jgi:hypothetical protein